MWWVTALQQVFESSQSVTQITRRKDDLQLMFFEQFGQNILQKGPLVYKIVEAWREISNEIRSVKIYTEITNFIN